MSRYLLAIPAALVLMGLATTAEAGPAGMPGAALSIKPAVATDALAETVTWRRCWRHHHHVHCARPAPRVFSFYVRPRHYFYGYYWNPRRWY